MKVSSPGNRLHPQRDTGQKSIRIQRPGRYRTENTIYRDGTGDDTRIGEHNKKNILVLMVCVETRLNLIYSSDLNLCLTFELCLLRISGSIRTAKHRLYTNNKKTEWNAAESEKEWRELTSDQPCRSPNTSHSCLIITVCPHNTGHNRFPVSSPKRCWCSSEMLLFFRHFPLKCSSLRNTKLKLICFRGFMAKYEWLVLHCSHPQKHVLWAFWVRKQCRRSNWSLPLIWSPRCIFLNRYIFPSTPSVQTVHWI